MRLTLTVVDTLTDRCADVVLDIVPGATVSQVGAAVAGFLRPGAGAATLYVEGTAVDLRVSLFASPLRDGVLVSLDDPVGCLSPEPVGLVEIRVVSGPEAGGVFRLDPGIAHIGGDSGVAVPVEDLSLPPPAVTVEVDADGTVAVTPETDLSAWLDGWMGSGSAGWRHGRLEVSLPPAGPCSSWLPRRRRMRRCSRLRTVLVWTTTGRPGCGRRLGGPGFGCRRHRPRASAGRHRGTPPPATV